MKVVRVVARTTAATVGIVATAATIKCNDVDTSGCNMQKRCSITRMLTWQNDYGD